MSRAPSQGLSAATLAILAGLGGRASAVTGGTEPATARPKPVTTDLSTKSNTYHRHVTGAHVLPHQVGPSDTWEERAAILEFEGGLPRPLAEALAYRLLPLSQMDGSNAETCALDRDLIEADRLRP